jgi:hypothetical protein
MSVTGEALQYFMSAIYTITGAVMGTTPGGDFLAAIEAAQSVGAQVRVMRREPQERAGPSSLSVLPNSFRTSAPAAAEPCLAVQVVLGDRDQTATLRRLEYYTRHLTRRDSRANVRHAARGPGHAFGACFVSTFGRVPAGRHAAPAQYDGLGPARGRRQWARS